MSSYINNTNYPNKKINIKVPSQNIKDLVIIKKGLISSNENINNLLNNISDKLINTNFIKMLDATFIDRKIEIKNNIGSIRYIGPLLHKEDSDIWIGIEWDDTSRGKHNGSVDNIQYFTCKGNLNSGSLIKLNKVNIGISLVESAKFKYAFYEYSDETNKFVDSTNESNSFIKLKRKKINIELIGKDKVNKKFTNLNSIPYIELDKANISTINEENFKKLENYDYELLSKNVDNFKSEYLLFTESNLSSASSIFNNLQELVITSSMFGRWSDYVRLVVELKNLTLLSFSNNVLNYDKERFDFWKEVYLSNIDNKLDTIILNSNNIGFKELDFLSFIINKSKSLYIYNNDINEKNIENYLSVNNSKDISVDLSNVKKLSLDNNNISNVVYTLSNLKAINLTVLNLNNNNISSLLKNICINDKTEKSDNINYSNNSLSNLFNTIEELYLDNNNIEHESILQEIEDFHNIKVLFILNNNYFEKIGLENSLKKIIGKLIKLKSLNNNLIINSERKEYEIYYLKNIIKIYFNDNKIDEIKHFNKENFINYIENNHRSYNYLIKKYYDPLEDKLEDLRIKEQLEYDNLNKENADDNNGNINNYNSKTSDVLNKNSINVDNINNIKQSKTNSKLVKIEFVYNNKKLIKNLPKSTTFNTLRNLISKMFKIEHFYFSTNFNNINAVIIDEGKTLDGYDITSGQIIKINDN